MNVINGGGGGGGGCDEHGKDWNTWTRFVINDGDGNRNKVMKCVSNIILQM